MKTLSEPTRNYNVEDCLTSCGSFGSDVLQSKEFHPWQQKVRTELCAFWLKGIPCENQTKPAGCGFAHGEHELQQKPGLNRQYLTSVCKNY